MSDYITGLRGDLVDAADRHRSRSWLRRTWLPRAWRPVLAVATVAAGALAVLVAASTLSTPPAQPAIASVVQLGGQPQDAVLAAGSLWIADFEGRVTRVDPATGRVTARISVEGHPQAIAAGTDGIWAVSPALGTGAESVLSRIDPHSGKVAERVRIDGYVDGIATGAGGLWLIDGNRLERIGARPARVPLRRASTLAAGGGTLWAIGADGAVVAVDGASLEVDRLRDAIGLGHGPAPNALAADDHGAWVVARGDGEVLRLEAGRIAARVPVADAIGQIAVGDDAVWVASGDQDLRAGVYLLSHIDPETGDVTAIEVGMQPPKALVASGDGVWVIAADGTATRVEPRT